jgi:hypothetical protein
MGELWTLYPSLVICKEYRFLFRFMILKELCFVVFLLIGLTKMLGIFRPTVIVTRVNRIYSIPFIVFKYSESYIFPE